VPPLQSRHLGLQLSLLRLLGAVRAACCARQAALPPGPPSQASATWAAARASSEARRCPASRALLARAPLRSGRLLLGRCLEDGLLDGRLLVARVGRRGPQSASGHGPGAGAQQVGADRRGGPPAPARVGCAPAWADARPPLPAAADVAEAWEGPGRGGGLSLVVRVLEDVLLLRERRPAAAQQKQQQQQQLASAAPSHCGLCGGGARSCRRRGRGRG